MQLVLATRNQGKLREIRELVRDTGIEVLSLEDFGDLPPVVEDGDTFEANAQKKARSIAELTGCLTLADDSGLVVEALNGQPGVLSARYAGEDATDADNNAKLIDALSEVPAGNRKGAFCCVMALCRAGGDCHLFSGRLEGEIARAPRGSGGFGYDPLFIVREYGKTLAELPLETKNRISHRGRALKEVVAFLKSLP